MGEYVKFNNVRKRVRVHLGLRVRELGDEKLEKRIEWIKRLNEGLGQHVC